jgi:hypothetical protein
MPPNTGFDDSKNWFRWKKLLSKLARYLFLIPHEGFPKAYSF